MSPARGAAAVKDEPGPPPLPPADLAGRTLPVHICPAGTVLFRVHRIGRGAVFFSPPAGSGPTGRWDAPAGEFGVCYLGEEPFVAFAETLLREPGRKLVESVDASARSMARIRVRRDLRLVSLHGPGLARIGATAAVCTGPYRISRAWALALHEHHDGVDGIRYRARHDDDGLAIGLFDRAGNALEEIETRGLMAPQAASELAAWLDRYGMGLA